MSTAPISGIGTTPAASTAATTAATTSDAPGRPVENPGAVLDRDAFLKLLVAQLKYQDPSKPADASQMVAQSAQLTMVDKLNEIAGTLEATATSNRWSLAGALVGKDVTFVDEDGVTRIEQVTSVRVDGDELMLTAGDFAMPLGAVNSVHQPPPTATVTTPGPLIPPTWSA